jgi:hypothetical protein
MGYCQFLIFGYGILYQGIQPIDCKIVHPKIAEPYFTNQIHSFSKPETIESIENFLLLSNDILEYFSRIDSSSLN